MQVIGIQLDSVWENPDANRQKVREMLRAAAIQRGALVALPEMFPSGFTMNLDAATREHETTVQTLVELCRELGIYIVAGMAAPGSGGKGQNRAVIIDSSGNIAANYIKLHPFTVGGESQHYEAGSQIVTFDWAGFTVAPFICYDLRFPEIFRVAMSKHRANFFVVVASWPIARAEHWITLLRARAIENQAFVLGVNRCGRDPNFLYPGRSMLIDPAGTIRVDAGDTEGLVIGDVDVATVTEYRAKLPFLKDLRDDFLV